jgi:hypothetical protein
VGLEVVQMVLELVVMEVMGHTDVVVVAVVLALLVVQVVEVVMVW